MRVFLSVILLMLSFTALSQKRDTIRNEEELLVASDLFQKSNEERRLMLLKPRFRYINKEDKRSLIKLGYRPDLGITIANSQGKGYSHSVGLAYERLLNNSPFSWTVETFTRLGKRGLGTYEYKLRPDKLGEGQINGQWFTSGEYYNHRFRVHTTLRYYFNMNKRIGAEASGHNMASEYVFFRMRDILAYTEADKLVFNIERVLESQIFEKKLLFRPAYFSIGLGTQRPFLNKGLIDFNIEIGRRFGASDFTHFHRDIFFDLNLFIGLGL